MTTTANPATITADQDVPAIHIERVFDATPQQLFRAHTEADLFAQWCGPRDLHMEIGTWDCRNGGEYRYTHSRDGANGHEEYHFRGCFHQITPTKVVQTFTFEGYPDGVALETMTFEDLGDGRTLLHAVSLCGSFAERDQWLASGMETGIDDGYARIDELVAAGKL